MKKILILLLFVTSILSAQEKEFKYSLSGIKKVVLASGTKIVLTAENTSELVLTDNKKVRNNHSGHEDHQKEKAEKRKGLTAVYPNGKDNSDGFGFSITKEGSVLYVTDLKSMYQRNGINLTLPKTMNISVNAGNLGSVSLEGFTGEVEVATNVGKIEMKNVTGPITANTSVGKIDIDFDKVSQTSPITISSSVSEIDVAIPANTKADLELRTQGTVYTNFDFDTPKKKGLPNVSGNKSINSKLNNGGVKIYIKSSMGNIYLRKK
ncbi:DUF4097 family beta strand repeat protein [Polaribacter haliotis]|uniref:DUF4097 family beta strand repeat protein n=1 Tax=Polaribacter haliotis TaxID=1888915 RepID=A0A7L8AE07_9FLAO|nr:DUF4097 family beta strand repeat-containing protein [Polaribacter haliotis]QOD60253.1 DUF4097 family beta strand repeat protein [Polaribacter haliotis]